MGNSPLQTVYTGDSIVVAAATMVHGFQIARTSPTGLYPQVISFHYEHPSLLNLTLYPQMLNFSNFIPAVVAQCYSPVHFIKLRMSSVGFQSIDTLLFMTHFTWSKCCQGSSLVPSGLPHSFASPGQARSCHPSWEGELNVSRLEA